MNIVSIIIPTYNRAHLIGETLDSIIAQTYPDWECIVVDDLSTDYTNELLEFYSKAYPRIKFHSRPRNQLKGANVCRNYGFTKSAGSYIIWFDSDDLLTSDHIEKKVRAIQSSSADFVVAQTVNFKGEQLLEPYKYEKKPYGIKASDFILLRIHWYTYDVMLKREVAEKISWNEKMKSWQDYNYFCKMLLVSESGDYIDEVLTHRRLHSKSIQKHLTKDPQTFNKELLQNRLLTYKDISKDIDSFTRTELIFGMMNLSFELSKMRIISREVKVVENLVEEQLGIKSKWYFRAALETGSKLKKGHYFLNKAKKRGSGK